MKIISRDRTMYVKSTMWYWKLVYDENSNAWNKLDYDGNWYRKMDIKQIREWLENDDVYIVTRNEYNENIT